MAGLKNQSKIIARNDDPLFHFPSKKNESWRFLNLNEYKKNEFKAFKKNIHFKKLNNLPKQSVSFNLDIINGNTNLNMLNNINTEAGFELIKIKEKSKYFNFDHYVLDNYYFINDNIDSIDDVLLIHIPKSIKIDTPLYLNHHTLKEVNSCSIYKKIVFVLEESSSLNIIERFSSSYNEKSSINISVEIYLKENSLMNYHRINSSNSDNYLFSNFYIQQNNDSKFSIFDYSKGSLIDRKDICIDLIGENASSYLKGLNIKTDSQQSDNHIVVNHKGKSTISDISYRGIYNLNSRGIFNVKSIVDNKAINSNVVQCDKNLLLSDSAQINSNPQLEINIDELACTHATTTGQLDQDALFYICSRGINHDIAKNILIKAFIQDMLDRIQLNEIKEIIEKEINYYVNNYKS